ncbi:MAG TPA: DinB family protein [Bryobacteraceae bacterium]|nr:DinB family protein [Bryobacteraceae bacterium]
MFDRTGLQQLYRDTHSCLTLLLDHADRMPGGSLLETVQNFGRSSVRDQLVHVFSNELVWIAGLQRISPARPDPEQCTDVASIRSLQQETQARTLAYLDRLEDRSLNAILDPPPPNWIGPPRSPAYILLHIITHAFHHKGQITAMFRILGHPIGETDLQRPSSS